jgi:S-adenosylmethionine synthetase
MEAAAGKNPTSHTGKLYALAAQELAEEIATQVGGVAAAECLLASRIGAPIDAPALFHLRVALRDGAVLGDVARMIGERAEAARTRLPGLWRRIVAGEARLF